MSNTIPPLLSNSPPPPPSPDDEEDDEFGNFTVSNEFSFTCDGFISSPSPLHSPKIEKEKQSTNITKRSENDEIEAVSEEMGIDNNVSLITEQELAKAKERDRLQITHYPTRLQNDVKNYSNSLSEKFHDESDILRIISGQFERLSLDNLNVEEEKCTELRDPSDDGNDVSNSEEDVKETVLINDFIQNDIFTSIHSEKKTCDIDGSEKSIAQLEVNDTNSDVETNILTKCIVNSSYLNGSHITNGDFIVEDVEAVGNISKEDENIDVLQTNDECAKGRDSLRSDDEQSSIINQDIQQINSSGCESTPTVDIDTFEDDIEDAVSHDVSSCVSSFDDSSSRSQDKLNSPDEIITTKSDPENYNVPEPIRQETPEEFDDFGDFATFSLGQDIGNSEVLKENAVVVPSQALKPPDSISSNDRGANDASVDFFGYNSNHISDNEISDDEFADFASFETPSIPNPTPSQPHDDDDDEFGVFSSATFDSQQTLCQPSTSQRAIEIEKMSIFEPKFLSLNEKEAFEKSKRIIQEMYPAFEEVLKDCEFISPEDDAIFRQLKDVTDTPALSYHWSKSTTQKFLLKALNIDVRNMIFGPTWNPTIPRFAAHMGLQPLEPIKADQDSSTSIKSNPSISHTYSADIPNVQFDWTSSGLLNPLEFDAKCTPTQIPDTLIQQIPETSLNPDPELPTSIKEPDFPDDNDFREFESYQPPAAPSEWRNVLPLRETHISYISSEPSIQSSDEAWLQPTIVTPELSRRKLSIEESTSTNVTTEVMKDDNNVQENEDDFDDFQMVLPEKDDNQATYFDSCSGATNTIVLDTLVSNDVHGSQISEFVNCDSSKSVIPTPTIPNVHHLSSTASSSLKYPRGNLGITNSSQDDDDDEFTDFHFSMPKVSSATGTMLLPSVTPLEPTPAYPKDRTQINWPDPGVTDEDLKKFENVFSSPLNFKQEANTASKSEPPQKKADDDEEWSDFVSVQKPSPVHKLKSSGEKERTSSPDLTLSVFNLGSIQPTRPPVPVITPQGLVQTKLSTNASHSSPKSQPKHSLDIRSTYVGQQPSIISNQFACQAYNFSVPNHKNSVPTGPSQIRDIMGNDAAPEEEWGEFVSSPLPPKPAQNAWAAQTPNIYMNPGHFVRSANEVGKRESSFSVNKKSTVSNSFMPELDFIAPKTRTTVSRKK